MAFGDVIGAVLERADAGEELERETPLASVARGALRAPPGSAFACPEIDCVRDLLPHYLIAAAERRARSIGMGADRVLVCADAITEEAYLTALATSLGTSYESLEGVSRAHCPLDDNQLIQAAAAGLLPLRQGGEIIWVIAPRCQTTRRLTNPHQQWPDWLYPFRLTSSERLSRFVARYTQKALGQRAAEGLSQDRPLLSNSPQPYGLRNIAAAISALVAAPVLVLVPAATFAAFTALLCTVFLASAVLRLSSALYTQQPRKRSTGIRDDQLPIYTIICALYREANVVGDLVAAIRSLDYPIEKLDVKFVVEVDDDETRRALAELDLGPPFEIITAPSIGPRTKPKALNVVLPLARGLYTAIYDAEDVPEPDQLRRAVEAFMASDDALACLQASLTIDNTADNWLVRMFTANYAGQFDVLLPGLAALRLPFPLGGSSNHFRTTALRQAGGWDPYNVTEDADLGIRLCRLGYRTAALPSATYEEAPARFLAWLKQRTRWYKGWMQTWRVHSRRPLRLMRELGPAGTIAFQLFLACNVLSALVHPFFMAALCYSLMAQPPLHAIGILVQNTPVFTTALIAGYASTIALDLVGLHRRGLLAHAWVLILTPLHWFLLSFAAWRALLQLLYDPQLWEKTEHGLAKNSRVAASRRGKAEPHDPAAVAPTAIMASATRPITRQSRFA